MAKEQWITVILKDGTRKSMPERLLSDFKKTLNEMEKIAKEANWSEEEIQQNFSIQRIVKEEK